ncbi:primosomal protein DnaI [Lactobacillus johnsonii]|uniref:Primosomal protein DnaI n=2 Tax=Lactobacillus johnsonii TaxID=33959 RepID=A0AAW5LRV7_LACJH|nr:primosomal protein DnaI [Lactobacillus johnsonii]AYN50164.1 Primosomal protein DnaI [Lactobacillus johnsonii]MBF0771351.1 primosomal protein DnaI [Lactobacillus johnsonii]MBU5318764.1 primosomal protein DnaI [Lactobacillus johnsonii]MCF1583026.1 primosomal protein DnaI [Lactobacillus johnsonii]MCI9451993.1 primosomal protein DnaI [Lactobacillus johnsonii]
MEDISEVITRIIKKRKLGEDSKKIAKTAIKHPKVQAFLAQNKERLNKEIVQASLPTIFTYVEQIESPNPVMEGYTPKLFLNGKVIDITYVPTEAKLNSEAKKRAENRIELIDLPAKLRHVELENVDATPERDDVLDEVGIFLASFKKNKHTKGLYLTGDFGVGKTYILAGLTNSIARQGSRVVFLHVPSFIASLGSHFQDNSLNDEIDRIASAPVLIFDDIGAETLSEWSRDDVLGVILQKRMDNVLPTFFSSNMTMDGLNEHFAKTRNSVDEVKARRLMERVRFLSKEVFVGGKNRRN